jgi:hypothetical protein
MKYLISPLLLILGLAFFWSCSENPTTDEPTDEPPVEAPNHDVAVPDDLALIFVPNKGVVRGHRFNEQVNQVKNRETAELVGQTGNTLNYSLGLNEAEFADLTYEFQGDELERIRVDIFAADVASAKNYGAQLQTWFNQKYTAQANLWDGSEDGVPFTSFLKVVDDPASPGVIVVWEKMQNLN